jgi:LPXTG-motif cell wall-anchored protein
VRKIVGFAIGFLALQLALPVPVVNAVSGLILPFVTPPGSVVDVQVRDCAAGTTTIEIAISPVGGAAVLDQSAPANVDGNARFSVTLPVDLTPGPHQVSIACMDDQATTIDTGVILFDVALLPVSVSPNSGPPGTMVTISGSGCPARTSLVLAKIVGASDDSPVFDATWTGPGAVPNADGSFVLTQQVPVNAPSGENQVIVFCIAVGKPTIALGGPGYAVFNVVNAVDGGTIPKTGVSVAATTAAGCALLVAGIGLMMLGRRRHRRHA